MQCRSPLIQYILLSKLIVWSAWNAAILCGPRCLKIFVWDWPSYSNDILHGTEKAEHFVDIFVREVTFLLWQPNLYHYLTSFEFTAQCGPIWCPRIVLCQTKTLKLYTPTIRLPTSVLIGCNWYNALLAENGISKSSLAMLFWKQSYKIIHIISLSIYSDFVYQQFWMNAWNVFSHMPPGACLFQRSKPEIWHIHRTIPTFRALVCFVVIWCLSISLSRRLPLKFREVSKPRDWGLNFSNRSEIWQAPRQQRYQDACRIWEYYDHYSMHSRGFETSRDLAVNGT